MHCVIDPDPRSFLEGAAAWFAADPIRTNVLSTVPANRVNGVQPAEADALWIRVLDERGAVAGAAIQTPPRPLLLGPMPGAAVDALAALLSTLRPDLPGVNGPMAAARRFADGYAPGRGELGLHMRLYALEEAAPPAPAPGTWRAATPTDRDLIAAWMAAFVAEATPGAPIESDDARRDYAARRIATGKVWLWDIGGQPVSTAAETEAAGGIVRVQFVYTPPEQRTRGYATNLVARLSQRILDAGHVPILYADMANPTSNAIYERIGYRPLDEQQEWRFRSA